MKMKEELLSPLKCDDVPGARVLSLVHQDTDEQDAVAFFRDLNLRGDPDHLRCLQCVLIGKQRG